MKDHSNTTSVSRRNRVGQWLLLTFLWLAVLVSGYGVIYSTFLSRQLLSELESMRRTANALHTEWSQYLLEYSALAAYNHVGEQAQEQLQMDIPSTDKIVIVER